MIRPATQMDEEVVLDLARAFDRFGPYVQIFAAMLRGDHAALAPYGVTGELALFVDEDGAGQRTGFVAVEWRERRVGHVHGVVVREAFRQRGVATLLLDHVVRLARERRIATLECITAESDNVPALGCFTQRGFRNVGHVGHYPRGQRAVRLRRELEGT